MVQCINCHYNLGGLQCVIHGQINFHNEYCNDYEEMRVRLYPEPIYIGYDVKYDGDAECHK